VNQRADWFGQPNNLVDMAPTKLLVDTTKSANQTFLVEHQPNMFG
jgi:hypothetical protein